MLRGSSVLFLMLLASCGAPTGPGGLQIDFTASRTSIAPGDTVVFTLTVSNRTPASVTVQGSSSCTFDWFLEDVHQVRVCTADLHPFTFAPGEARTFTFPWAGYVDDIEGRPTALPPGAYVARGLVDASEGQGQSDPVTVTVTGSYSALASRSGRP